MITEYPIEDLIIISGVREQKKESQPITKVMSEQVKMPVRHFLCRDYLHILCYIKFLIFVSLFHQIRIYIKVMIPSIINTAAQAPIATTIRLFLW